MKTCPNCGELNGEGNNECYKCKTPLPEREIKKSCPRCGLIFSARAERCTSCSGPLVVIDGSSTYASAVSEAESVGEWVLTLFLSAIPLIGLIMLFIWGFGSGATESKQNFARAMLIFYAIGFVISVLGAVCYSL